MKTTKNIVSFAISLMLLCSFGACKKAGIKQNSPIASAADRGVFYTDAKTGVFLAEFIGVDSKSVYTGIILPGNAGAKLTVPAYLASGHYDVLLSPEGAISKTTTHYTVGGVSGITDKYPVTIKNVYIPVDASGTVSISLR